MNSIRLVNRFLLLSLLCALCAFATGPVTRADIPPDQIKAAGAIPLTTELLDKMDKFVKQMTTNTDAKAELNAASNDPSMNPDTWGSTVSAKCPKTVEVFKSAGITPDEFGKAIFAMMAIAMSDELAKSEDKAVKANADFFAANKAKADAVFGGFMALSIPPDAGSSPAATP